MGAFSKRLKYQGTDLVTKEEVAQALSTIILPLTREIDDLKARVSTLEAEIEHTSEQRPVLT